MQIGKDALPDLAQALVAYAAIRAPYDRAQVIALTGDLGAGKTTLTQYVAEALGVEHLVPSPTFVIMRSYATTHARFKRLVHIDAYRLEEESELAPLHLESVFSDPESLVCVEWPERLGNALPEQRINVALGVVDGTTRSLASDSALEGYLQKYIKVV